MPHTQNFGQAHISRYTRSHWGETQAPRSITGLFEAFERIESHGVECGRVWSPGPVPAEFGVECFFFRYGRHVVYWRRLSDGDIGIVTVLHERMHQIGRFREDFFGGSPGEGLAASTPP